MLGCIFLTVKELKGLALLHIIPVNRILGELQQICSSNVTGEEEFKIAEAKEKSFQVIYGECD